MIDFRKACNGARYIRELAADEQCSSERHIATGPSNVFQTALSLVMAESEKYMPMPRHSHASVRTGDRKVLVYSGWTQDQSEESKHRLASMVEVFDPFKKAEWEAKKTSGDVPDAGVKYQICASAKNCLYMYGGCGEDKAPVKSLHQLNAETMMWRKLSSGTEPTSPMAKHSGGMIAYGDKLALLGGYGIPHNCEATQTGSSFIP